MKKRFIKVAFVILILLTVGLFLFRTLNRESTLVDESGFRTWLWETRELDLFVQVMLVFGGALGIAAILPLEGMDE